MKDQHHRTIVKREHPYAGRRRLLMLLLIISAVGAIGFWAGQRGVVPAPVLNDGTIALRDQINQLTLQSEADQQTLDELREYLADQAAELVELRQTLGVLSRRSGTRRGRNCDYLAPTLCAGLNRTPAVAVTHRRPSWRGKRPSIPG
jgi:hypothetical protein